MGLRKKFRDWCPQPPDRLPTQLRRRYVPIAAIVTVSLILSVSFLAFSSSLASNPSVPIVPLADVSASTVPTLLWNSSAGGGALAVENGAVYVSAGSYVCALNASDGSVLWNNSEAWDYGGVTVADGEVFTNCLVPIIDETGRGCDGIIAINAKTGNETMEWYGIYGFANDFSTPAVAGGMVYVGSGAWSVIYGINAKTGKTIWTFNPGGAIWSTPVVANGKVYFSGGGALHVLKANGGDELWNSTIDKLDSFVVSPVVVNGVIYIGSSDGNVYALDANNGNKLWNCTTGAVTSSYMVNGYSGDGIAYTDSYGSNPVGGLVYVYSQNGCLYALNATSGEKLWNQTAPANPNPTSPDIANNVVYIGSGDGNIYAFDAANGDKLWNYTVEANSALSTPSIVNGVLYVSAGNNVYALRVSPSASSTSPVTYPLLYVAIGVAVLGFVVVTIVVLVLKKGRTDRRRWPIWAYAILGFKYQKPHRNIVCYFLR